MVRKAAVVIIFPAVGLAAGTAEADEVASFVSWPAITVIVTKQFHGGFRQVASLGVEVDYHVDRVLEWCDVANVLRIQTERMQLQYFPSANEYARFFGITKAKLDKLGHRAVIMHPGPINRGVEIDSSVADGSQSVILPQVTFGIAVRMAVMSIIAGNSA